MPWQASTTLSRSGSLGPAFEKPPIGIQNELFCRGMIQQEIIFKKPVQVVQVFRMINMYGKDEKSFSDRKDKLVWREMSSGSGYVANGILYLPPGVHNDKKFGNCDLITIEDECDVTSQDEWKMISGKYERGNNHCFNLHHPGQYEIFTFNNDPIEISLYYSYSYVGAPSRDNFTLAVLEKNAPVEVKVNGKLDTSRGRYFKEQLFIFQLLGRFDRCCILNEAAKPVVKFVPPDRKLVDLLKPLW
jgi:hypothetical protein